MDDVISEMLSYLDDLRTGNDLNDSQKSLVEILQADIMEEEFHYVDYTLSTFKNTYTNQEDLDFCDKVRTELFGIYLLGRKG